ncbi:DUF7095 family protein [Halocatena halophila]|uniref:DUF7095 family protein n=1 Tax=Halocatena halophila TaxID=2814576 RepID=UPI002ED11F2F
MAQFSRSAAVDRLERLIEQVETESMAVPVRELWVYGDLVLGVDPVERLSVYCTKELLFENDDAAAASFRDSHGIDGVGKTVSAEWAREFPEALRANANGHVAPEKCLAAQLIDDEPIHLEVCNTGFERNVTQRLKGAMARSDYEQILDPRGVCLWVDGTRSTDAFEKLRAGELVFPTLAESLTMLGMDQEQATEAATTVMEYRERQDGVTVRGDIV